MRHSRTSTPELRAIVDDGASTATLPPSAEPALRLLESSNGTHAGETQSLESLVTRLIGELRSLQRRSARIVVKTDGRLLFLRVSDIDWVEASGNYVKVHVGSNAYVCRESMKNMETRLDSEMFLRIHRSSIVNVERIRQLEPWSHGEYVVQLEDGTRLMASRVFSERIARFIV